MDENNGQGPVPTGPSPATPPTATPNPVAVGPEPPINTSMPVADPNVLDIFEGNREKRARAIKLTIGILGVGAGIILILTVMGLPSRSYSYVRQLDNYATIVVWLIAIVTGILAAYLTAHPSNFGEVPRKGTGGILALVAVGIFMGLIPGLIILALYLLMKRRRHTEASTKQLASKPVRVILVVLSFIVGFLPGLIVAFMISYPLSKHACELSGSKYC